MQFGQSGQDRIGTGIRVGTGRCAVIRHSQMPPADGTVRWPVSRVLYPQGVTAIHLARLLPAASSDLPGQRRRIAPATRRQRVSLHGLAPDGVYHARPVTSPAVRSYRTFSPLPARPLPAAGGLFSVALSLGLPPPGVTRHPDPVEPGLSSPRPARDRQQPSGHLTAAES